MEFPDLVERAHQIYDAVTRAQQLGTLNAIDRSRQYENADTHDLLRAVNEAWSKIRRCEKAIDERDSKILDLEKRLKRYRIVNIALTSIITGLAWEGCKALVVYLTHLTQ